MFKNITCLLITVVLLSVVSTFAQTTYSAKVIGVVDGNTIIIAIPNGKLTVQLQYIEVPVSDKEWRDFVRAHLNDLVAGKTVQYQPRMLLPDRTIGKVTLDGVDISQQMLRDGAAWHVPFETSGQTGDEQELYASMESAARNEQRGVWAVPDLKPSWASAEPKKEKQPVIVDAAPPPPEPPKRGKWGDVNPSLGNVGALMHGYNAESKIGFFGTAPLGLDTPENMGKTGIDFTYFYKEDDKKGRVGDFYVTIYSVSSEPRFTGKEDLVLLANGEPSSLGKPIRTAAKNGDSYEEQLRLRITRATVEKIMTGADVYLRIGSVQIRPTGLKYFLSNMLQLAV